MNRRKQKTRRFKGGPGKAVRAGQSQHTEPLAAVQSGSVLFPASDLLRAMAHTPSGYRIIVPQGDNGRVMQQAFIVCGATGAVTVLDVAHLGRLAALCKDPGHAAQLRGFAAEAAGMEGNA